MSLFNKIRSKVIPSCNKEFTFRCIRENKRIDERDLREYRLVSIGFGLEYGSCIVSLGSTKVMCNISYQIQEPKASKPCEGLLNIQLDLSPLMVYNHEKSIEIMRIIEKNIKDSKCIDLESLCLISNEKVCQLDADLIVMNDEGNIAECCSIALLSSLSHYKRPDIVVIDNQIKIFSMEERHPLPLNILHYPFCISYVFFEKNKFVCDPTLLEEQVCDGYLIVGANIYREITTVHISGNSMISKNTVLNCCNIAIERSKYLTKLVKTAVEEDMAKRKSQSAILGLVPLVKERSSVLCGFKKDSISIETEEEEEEPMEDLKYFEIADKRRLYRFAPEVVGYGEGGKSSWNFEEFDFEDEDIQEIKNDNVNMKDRDENPTKKTKIEEIELPSSSDDEVQILESSEFK